MTGQAMNLPSPTHPVVIEPSQGSMPSPAILKLKTQPEIMWCDIHGLGLQAQKTVLQYPKEHCKELQSVNKV